MSDARTLTVLAYHRIADGDGRVLDMYRRRGMVVSVASFEAQLRAAARHFEPVHLTQVEQAFRGERALPSRALLVTVDDGYADVQVAVPLARRLGVPVALFVRTPQADALPSWAPLDLLYYARAQTGGRVDTAARNEILQLPVADQVAFALSEVGDLEQANAWRRELYADERSLRELVGPGVEFGSHGIEHVRWTQLEATRLRHELAESRRWLARFGTAATDAVAYPDGAVDARVERSLVAEGVSIGFMIGAEVAAGVAQRFAIGRLVARDDAHWIEGVVSKIEVAS